MRRYVRFRQSRSYTERPGRARCASGYSTTSRSQRACAPTFSCPTITASQTLPARRARPASCSTRAVRDWLRVRGAAPASVLIIGSGLGTGVAVQFASALEEEADARDKKTRSGVTGWVQAVRERLRGMVFLSPFNELETLLDTYYILGLVAPFTLLRTIAYLANFIRGFMIHRFDSLAKVVIRTLLVLPFYGFPFPKRERGFVPSGDDALRFPIARRSHPYVSPACPS
ncbi:hypothetical protein EDB86DRAFT_1283338 [Lactarius hatsudake]|nr:hypothetical protein EDB86DRAFT_1283338 [Lactarius hatsudake]